MGVWALFWRIWSPRVVVGRGSGGRRKTGLESPFAQQAGCSISLVQIADRTSSQISQDALVLYALSTADKTGAVHDEMTRTKRPKTFPDAVPDGERGGRVSLLLHLASQGWADVFKGPQRGAILAESRSPVSRTAAWRGRGIFTELCAGCPPPLSCRDHLLESNVRSMR